MKTIVKQIRGYVNIGNKGYTLMEALLGLAAFCLIAVLIPLSFHVLSGVNLVNSRHQAMQWEVFSSQIKKEIRMSQRIDPQINRLLLTKDTVTITYELSGSNLRRRVNFTGNEILLQNVKSVRFESLKNGVVIKVEDIWDRNYIFSARSYLNLGN
jgi:competence protein ComGF